jgi:hypothetical protein
MAIDRKNYMKYGYIIKTIKHQQLAESTAYAMAEPPAAHHYGASNHG